MVSELVKVQQALGDGYLSAFPASLFDRLEALTHVWAPYYTIHKIIAGLLDAHDLAGIKAGLHAAVDMAQYHHGRAKRVMRELGMGHWYKVLDTEFGGMNDVMYRMYRSLGAPWMLELAHAFDKPRFYEPLATGQDPLAGIHANTHLAQVRGAGGAARMAWSPGVLCMPRQVAMRAQHAGAALRA